MASVVLTEVRKAFPGSLAVDRVSLEIADGEFLTLVGPSGCGKSTLLRIIAGLEAQDEGEVAIGGRGVDELRPAERNIAMVFQSYALYPHLNAFDIMAVPLRLARLSWFNSFPVVGRIMPGRASIEREIGEQIHSTARMLGIEDLLARKPGQMSGGQRQRVALGRAIVRRPLAFLLDEPLSSLDAKLRAQMRTELVQLQRRLGATFIYVTHDQLEAMTMSDRIAVMFDGRIAQLGPPTEIYRNPLDLRVAEFIGSPAINVVKGTVRDRWLCATDCKVPLAGQPVDAEQLSLAFRPEAARIASRDDALFTGTVVHVEEAGADRFIHVGIAAASSPIMLRAPLADAAGSAVSKDMARVGGAIAVGVAARDILVFDADGKRRTDIEVAQPGRNTVRTEAMLARGS